MGGGGGGDDRFPAVGKPLRFAPGGLLQIRRGYCRGRADSVTSGEYPVDGDELGNRQRVVDFPVGYVLRG